MELKDFDNVSFGVAQRVARLSERIRAVRAASIGLDIPPANGLEGSKCGRVREENLQSSMVDFFVSLDGDLDRAESDLKAVENSLLLDCPTETNASCAVVGQTHNP